MNNQLKKIDKTNVLLESTETGESKVQGGKKCPANPLEHNHNSVLQDDNPDKTWVPLKKLRRIPGSAKQKAVNNVFILQQDWQGAQILVNKRGL